MSKYLSYSADSDSDDNEESNVKGLFLDKLMPVQLNSTDSQDYSQYFFPKTKGKKVDPNLPSKGDLFDMIGELNHICTTLNGVYEGLRNVIRNYYNRDLSTHTPQDVEALLALAQNTAKYALDDVYYKEELKRTAFLTFLQTGVVFEGQKTVSQHMPYIIKPSVQYRNGYDVLWIGSSGYSFGNSPLMGAQPSTPLESQRSNIITQTNYDYKYNSDIGKECYAAIKYLNDLFTEGSANSVANCKSRKVCSLPLDFDFEQLNSIFDIKCLGGSLFKDGLFKNLDSKYAKYKKYFSLLTVVNPNVRIIEEVQAHIANGVPFDTTLVNEPNYVTTPNLSFSIALHLPEAYVNYITQTSKGQQPSLVSMCQWISLWSSEVFRKAGTKRTERTGKPVRYVVRPAEVAALSTKRRDSKLHNETGTTDDNDITITNRGTLLYCPKSKVLDQASKNAIAYSNKSERLLKSFFDIGFTPKFSIYDIDSLIEVETGKSPKDLGITDAIEDIANNEGVLLAGTWDYGKAVISGQQPHKTSILDISGVVPDDLIVASFIDNPYSEALSLIFGSKLTHERQSSSDEDTGQVLGIVMAHIAALYNALYNQKKVRSVQELIDEAAAHFGIATLSDPKIASYEDSIYLRYLDDNLLLKSTTNTDNQFSIVNKLLYCVTDNCGSYGTLSRTIQTENPGVDSSTLLQLVKESDRFFSERNNFTTFKNVYNWIGGYVYYLALSELRNADFDSIFGINQTKNYPSAGIIMQKVMPYVIAATVYVPNSEAILKQAENIKLRNSINDDIDIDDIKVPGTLKSAKLMPHQIKAHKYLRNKPRFAVLDIQAGGGKTITTLTDIACTVRELGAEGKSIRPLIICPDNLIKNWCEDIKKVVGSNWNMIPINTRINRDWGPEKLDSIIKNAPVNTIVVTGINFISKATRYSLIIGGKKQEGSMSLEFLKNYGFNYIAVDECHKAKNTSSRTHKLLKQLCNSSDVNYVRLLSGTLIPNIPSDIVGVSSLLSGHIFRTRDAFEKEVESSVPDSASADDKYRSGYKIVKQRLKDNVSLVTVKRKEWAFLLPSPIETFINVFLSYGEDTTHALKNPEKPPTKTADRVSQAHREIYEAVLNESAQKMEAFLTSVSDDNDDDNADDAEDALDDALDSATDNTGKYHFQRLDRIVMDPRSDPYGKEVFDALEAEGVDTSSYVPRKIREIIKRLSFHYKKVEWMRGEYSEYDVVEYNGDTYVALRSDGDDGTFISTLPPDRDNIDAIAEGRWKKEARGKVIILCQYTTSITAIYDHLPQNFQDVAVKIYNKNSSAKNDQNLQAFMKSDNAQILICQADRIAEGFNLQCASRLIRAEAPWTPGSIEQSNARLFRPLPGQARREVIHLDWIVTNATLEVIKVSKLQAKTLDNCKYDEVDNKDGPDGSNMYANVLRLPTPPKPRLSSVLLGRNKPGKAAVFPLFGDYVEEYFKPYKIYCEIRNEDFDRMRHSGAEQSMVDLLTLDVPKDYKRLTYVPYVPRQSICDPNNFQFENFEDYLQNDGNVKTLNAVKDELRDTGLIGRQRAGKSVKGTKWVSIKDLGELPKLKVHFEGGYGVIDQIQLYYDPNADDACPVSQVKIRSAKGIINTVDASCVYVINNLTELNKDVFINAKPIFEDNKRASSKVDATVDDDEEPVEETLDEEEPVEETLDEEEVTLIKPSVIITPVVYNQYIGLEVQADSTDDNDVVAGILNNLGLDFQYHGKYVAIRVHDKKSLKIILDDIRAKGFLFSKACVEAIKSLISSFSKETLLFNVATAPIGQLKTFYIIDHKMGSKEMLRIYPVVSSGKLELVINYRTNREFAKEFVNKPIKGLTQPQKAFKIRDGMHIMLMTNKSQLGKVLSKVVKSDLLDITNKAKLKLMFANIKTHLDQQ